MVRFRYPQKMLYMMRQMLSFCHLLQSDFIISPRPPRYGILNPPIDIRLPPSGTVDTDPDLSRKCAFGDLAIHG